MCTGHRPGSRGVRGSRAQLSRVLRGMPRRCLAGFPVSADPVRPGSRGVGPVRSCPGCCAAVSRRSRVRCPSCAAVYPGSCPWVPGLVRQNPRCLAGPGADTVYQGFRGSCETHHAAHGSRVLVRAPPPAAVTWDNVGRGSGQAHMTRDGSRFPKAVSARALAQILFDARVRRSGHSGIHWQCLHWSMDRCPEGSHDLACLLAPY